MRETGSSNWLSVVLVKEYNQVLNKQQFWDGLRLRYNQQIPGLPCKKGGFITILLETCKDVEVEPSLIEL